MVDRLTVNIALLSGLLDSTFDPLSAASVVLTHLHSRCKHSEQQCQSIWRVFCIAMTIVQELCDVCLGYGQLAGSLREGARLRAALEEVEVREQLFSRRKQLDERVEAGELWEDGEGIGGIFDRVHVLAFGQCVGERFIAKLYVRELETVSTMNRGWKANLRHEQCWPG